MPTPTTVVLFGATGDLAQRKLLPGLLHLFQSGLLTEVQVVGTSLDEHDRDSFVEFAAQGGRGVRRRGTRARGVGRVRQAAALGARCRRAPRHCARRSPTRRREFGDRASCAGCTT